MSWGGKCGGRATGRDGSVTCSDERAALTSLHANTPVPVPLEAGARLPRVRGPWLRDTGREERRAEGTGWSHSQEETPGRKEDLRAGAGLLEASWVPMGAPLASAWRAKA